MSSQIYDRVFPPAALETGLSVQGRDRPPLFKKKKRKGFRLQGERPAFSSKGIQHRCAKKKGQEKSIEGFQVCKIGRDLLDLLLSCGQSVFHPLCESSTCCACFRRLVRPRAAGRKSSNKHRRDKHTRQGVIFEDLCA